MLLVAIVIIAFLIFFAFVIAKWFDHRSKKQINDMIKKYSGKAHVQSKAYEDWTITRCIK